MSHGATNGNTAERVVMHGGRMDWQPSPSGTVWRKRLHRVGPPEAGQVTSIVRYEPDSRFPEHDHPEGEEFLVLDGVFSDQQGDFAAGSYVLNPEGFRHAPFSRRGCTLFVKLRQYGGDGREHRNRQTEDLPWQSTAEQGVHEKVLYQEARFLDTTRLERWDAGTSLSARVYKGGAEILVLDGSFRDAEGTYEVGSWLRLPDGFEQRPATVSGCTLYVKSGGVSELRCG